MEGVVHGECRLSFGEAFLVCVLGSSARQAVSDLYRRLGYGRDAEQKKLHYTREVRIGLLEGPVPSVCVCMYVRTYVCMYACMYVYIYTSMHIYVCIYTYIFLGPTSTHIVSWTCPEASGNILVRGLKPEPYNCRCSACIRSIIYLESCQC